MSSNNNRSIRKTSRRIFIWRGYQSEDAYTFFKFCWDNDHLLICTPPNLTDFSFVRALPTGEVAFCGSWERVMPTIVQADGGAPYPDSPVLGVFTTGTTRHKPKLVLYSKANILAGQEGILRFFKMDRIRGVFCYPQPYHVFGLLLGYALCHHRRIPLFTGNGPYGSNYHQARVDLRRDQILTLATPTHARDLSSFLETTNQSMTPSYSCILGGAKVNVADWKLARNKLKIRRPSIGYGCSEASPGIAHLPPGQEPLEDGEIGYPLHNLTIQNDGINGLTCWGDSIALATVENGYLQFPRSIHVKDHIETFEDGRLIFRGRTDMVLNRGGEKYPLEKIESILRRELDLTTVCVALPHDRLGEELGVLIRTPHGSSTLPESRIRATLTKSLGREFSDLKLKAADSLPVNSNAKIDRKAAVKILRNLE